MYVSIEGLGHFFSIYFPGFVCFVFTRPRYQVSVYRTIGPLVEFCTLQFCKCDTSESIIGRGSKLYQLVEYNEKILW